MLSGAFLIDNRNSNFGIFYKKMAHRIVIPTIIFSIIYVFMHYAETFVGIFMNININNSENKELLTPIRNLIMGQPHVTMWFMFMLIGLYLITPIIIFIKNSISKKAYRYLAAAMMIYGIFVAYTCELSWILSFAKWIGYFMLGNVIRDISNELKSLGKNIQKLAIILIGISYSISIVYWYIFTYKTGVLNNPSSFSFIVVVGAIIQFIGFSLLNINKEIEVISVVSKYSMDIYMLHPMFLEVIMQVFGRLLKWFPSACLIPIYAIFITIICIIVVYIYKKLWQMILRINMNYL